MLELTIAAYTLADFGPGPRDLQAQLIAQVNQYNPRAVIVDIVYAGESDQDAALLQQTGRIKNFGLPLNC